ncbi:MAG: NACHT domain-containing protein [Magnetococcus sp. YQC-5]
MEQILTTIISYLVRLAANLRSDAIADGLNRKLQEQLKLQQARGAKRPLREDLNAACVNLARNYRSTSVTPQEEALLYLLTDVLFQNDLYEWLVAGDIVEGQESKKRLQEMMEHSLRGANAVPDQMAFLQHNFFEALDKAVFADPMLASWRHQLTLDYLREQVIELRRRAEEAAGHFSPAQQKAALDLYCDKALAAWDIIDLSNLPEGDIQLATQKLLLRQLYMPLLIQVESTQDDGEESMAKLEAKREIRRHREAGHLPMEEPDQGKRSNSSVGERLGISHRLVVLGEPGGGKTTLLRWMATAYLLRYKGDSAFKDIPDTDTLPAHSWIPVLIRCRDLGDADLCRSFNDFLTQHLNKTELRPEEAKIMQSVILDRIAKGEVLLAVDGLDEIANPRVRMMFCQELERTAARYPQTPIVVTSRIVGYRNMPYRMGAGFEHGVIADLSREDKDAFAMRWVQVTEQHLPQAEQTQRILELREALHSSNRIERLTGNPMLLTTLALVKRKVGKLPTRRTKLYAEAVSVLLNWNQRYYATIDEDEAIPQLEYLAFEMCRRGVQRLSNDEVLDLLDRLRTEYPNIRFIRQRTPEAFLKLLEERSSILIMSGAIWHTETPKGQPAWEFRHLTFQEYLAARALLDGCYPDRDKSKKSLAQQVGPLAGHLEKAHTFSFHGETEEKVSDAWHEALRLLVADCKDDDVDDVLRAILEPMPNENAEKSIRPRAVLAALCLADEPNVSEEVAHCVLTRLATTVGKNDGFNLKINTLVDEAAAEVGRSSWSGRLRQSLILVEQPC